MRGGGLEPEKALEMIELFSSECCAVWRLVAKIGPRGPMRKRGSWLKRHFQRTLLQRAHLEHGEAEDVPVSVDLLHYLVRRPSRENSLLSARR